MRRMMPEVKNLVTSKKPLVIVPVVLALVLAGLFLPVKVSIEPYGVLSLESKITISIGYEAAYASPGTERQSPDVLLLQTNLSGSITDIQDDPDSPDANWLTAIVEQSKTVCHVSFSTPTGDPTQGAGLQEFKIWVRKDPGTGTPTVRIDLYESNSLITTIMGASDVTSESGQLFSATWDASLLGTADGSQVECYIYGTGVAGPSAVRTTVEVGAVEWNVTYTPPPLSNFPTSHNFGTVTEGSTTQTDLIYFTVTNNSLSAVNITIGGTDMTGGDTWTLSNDGGNSVAGTYGLMAGLSGTSYNIIVKRDPTYNTLISGLGASSSQQWGLQFLAPSTFTDGIEKSGIVTLTATF